MNYLGIIGMDTFNYYGTKWPWLLSDEEVYPGFYFDLFAIIFRINKEEWI